MNPASDRFIQCRHQSVLVGVNVDWLDTVADQVFGRSLCLFLWRGTLFDAGLVETGKKAAIIEALLF